MALTRFTPPSRRLRIACARRSPALPNVPLFGMSILLVLRFRGALTAYDTSGSGWHNLWVQGHNPEASTVVGQRHLAVAARNLEAVFPLPDCASTARSRALSASRRLRVPVGRFQAPALAGTPFARSRTLRAQVRCERGGSRRPRHSGTRAGAPVASQRCRTLQPSDVSIGSGLRSRPERFAGDNSGTV